jgi:addiction module HigA family antidote
MLAMGQIAAKRAAGADKGRWSIWVNGNWRLTFAFRDGHVFALSLSRGLPLMQMHNPPHPGEFIEGVYLEPCELSIRQVAERLGVSASTFQRLVAGKSRVSPDMALRLSRVLGRSAESWLAMQDSHDLWQARQRLDLSGLTPMELTPG